jgi:malate permease and related proteins
MREMIFNVSGVIAPVLICVLVGFALAKTKAPFEHNMVSSLVTNVGYPTLILSNLTANDALLDELLEIMLATAALIACFGGIGLAVLKLMRLPVRAYLSPMIFNNNGNVGLPVCALAFGDQGLALGMGCLVVMQLGLYTIGIALPRGKLDFRDLVRQPVIYAVVLGLVLMATDTDLPKPIASAFDILGGLTIPLLLLTLGHSLATLNVAVLSRGAVLAVVHLIMAAAVAFLLVWLFHLDGLTRDVFILQCMMPVAIITYLWVERYDPEEAPGVASFVLVSTILAAIALPLVLTFWI